MVLEKNKTTLLCIADLHHWEEEEIIRIRSLEYDLCVVLGDIPQEALEKIVDFNENIPIVGVVGNHDDWGLLKRNGIIDIDCKSIYFNGYTISGFGGASRYKNGDYPMLTQAESIVKSFEIPKGDILISHDSMYKLFSKKDIAHIGLKGITKYIKKGKVKLNICGHHHENTIKKRGKCKIICVYRFSLITLEDCCVENISTKPDYFDGTEEAIKKYDW